MNTIQTIGFVLVSASLAACSLFEQTGVEVGTWPTTLSN